ncbi:ABC transporter substrate-binding protein [Atopobiaceae bacterium 24-176]
MFALCTALALVLWGCGTSESFSGDGGQGGDAQTIVVGSQDFYENEIVAETYAEALEANGFDVERSFRIGQREVYMPEIESGSIDVFPEYTGNLLQYLDEDATATEGQDVYDALVEAMPDGLRVLEQAEAADSDSYVVTKAFADEHGLVTIADLSGVEGLVLAGNSELESRPYGPTGLKDVYGVDIARFAPVEDSGGPLTVKALRDGDATMVDMYSSSPELASGDLVALEDPKGMFLASHVVPVVSERVDGKAAAVLDRVSAALTQEALVRMNGESVNDGRPAPDIAHDFLVSAGVVS